MPTSSAFSTDNQYIKYRITVTETSYSIENNTSTVNVVVDAWRTNTGYTTSGTGTCYCVIWGTKYSASISASQTITHNSHTVLFRRNGVVIGHASDGTRNLGVSAYIKHQKFSSKEQGFTVKLTDIPRQANITDVTDFTDEQDPTITYNNLAGEVAESLQACISLDGTNPLTSYIDLDKLGASYTFELTQATRDSLLQATPNSNTLTVYFIVKTVIAGVTYYSTKTATMTVVNANPRIVAPNYIDTNATTTAITSDNKKIIQNNSIVQVKATRLDARKYATLSSISIKINNVTVTESLGGEFAILNYAKTWGVIDSANDLVATVTVTDSRGNTLTDSFNITMLAWSLPTAIISVSRKNNFYDESYLYVNADYTSLDGNNAITITYRYKQASSQTWSSDYTMQDEATETLSLLNTAIWDIQVIVADRIGQTTYNTQLDRGVPIAFFDRLLKAFGVEKLPTLPNGIDTLGGLKSDNDILFTDSGTNIRQVKGIVGGSDYFRLAGGATASDSGFMEIATGGDANEPIYARQYSGDYSQIGNEATILDSAGKTILNALDVNGAISAVGDVTGNGIKFGEHYTTTEQKVGTWINGETLYQKTIELSSTITVGANTTAVLVSYIEPINVVDFKALRIDGDNYIPLTFVAGYWANSVIYALNPRATSIGVDTFTITYFKQS